MEEDIKWLNIELNGGGGKSSGEGTLTSENIEQLEEIASNRQDLNNFQPLHFTPDIQ